MFSFNWCPNSAKHFNSEITGKTQKGVVPSPSRVHGYGAKIPSNLLTIYQILIAPSVSNNSGSATVSRQCRDVEIWNFRDSKSSLKFLQDTFLPCNLLVLLRLANMSYFVSQSIHAVFSLRT